jgi:DNA-binding transcriptional MerR regulator
MPRESKTSERRLAALERQRQALELRKAGVSFVKIAELLGYRAGAFEAVKAALKRTLQQPADDLRKLEGERLDMAMQAIAARVRQGDLGAIDRWLRCCESRRKLDGLDAPQKHALTDPEGNDAFPSLEALMKMERPDLLRLYHERCLAALPGANGTTRP